MVRRRSSIRPHSRERQFALESLERRDCPAVISITGPAELREAGAPVTLIATLSEPQSRPVTVQYTTAGSAKAGLDYGMSILAQRLRNPSGSFMFPAGVTSLPITLTPRNDALREATETIEFNLLYARGHTLGSKMAAVSLLDDDSYTASIVGPARVARNSSTTFRIELSSPATRQEVFFVGTEDRSAGTPGDYAALRNVQVVFQPGQRVREFRIMTTAGSGPDRDETFAITVRARSLDMPAVTPFIVTIEGDGQSGPPNPPPGPPFTEATFTHPYGWGIVNAAAAVSKAIGGTTAFPEVPQLGGVNWGNDIVRAPEVWAQGYTGQGIVVAVVDSGVDYNHPSLRDKIWVNAGEIPGDGIDNDNNGFVDDVRGWDFVDGGPNGDNDPMDEVLPDPQENGGGHGTHVAGTIAASSSQFGPSGVAFDARIMPLRVFDEFEENGRVGGLAESIQYAANNGAHIINLSLRWSNDRDVIDALRYATSRGTIVVAAAGNFRTPSPMFPASLADTPGVISVGAINEQLHLAEFSAYAGFSPTLKHVVAPGENVRSTVPAGYVAPPEVAELENVQVTAAGTFASFDGTSMAAPHVTGVVALMLSALPNPKAPGVRDRIVDALRSTSQQPPPLTAPAPASLAARSATAAAARGPLVAYAAGRPVTTIAATVASAADQAQARPQAVTRPVVMPRVAAPASRPSQVAAFAVLEADRSRRTEPARPTRIEAPAIAMRQLAASRLPRGLAVTEMS